MTTKFIPTLPRADVESHDTVESCFVTVGTKVYDITPFLQDHPGGADLVVQYGGKDVGHIMKDMLSHAHSEVAYEILEEHFAGYIATEQIINVVTDSEYPDQIVPLPATAEGAQDLKAAAQKTTDMGATVYATTGMSSAEDLSKDTDTVADYRAHKFLDLDKPLLMQLWNGGFSKQFYLEQVHRPRHYKGGQSAPLFGNFLEPLSKTPWWVVPAVWLPPVVYGTMLSGVGLGNFPLLVAYWMMGLCIWTLVEYGLHRCLFHVDLWVMSQSIYLILLTMLLRYLPDNRVFLTLHFLLHGVHHYLPMDRLRLVMPPSLFVILATPFWKLAQTVFFYDWNAAVAVYCGGIFGYICYDLTHYFLHHKK